MDNKAAIRKTFIYNTIGTGVYLGCQWLITILIVRLSGYSDAGILSLAMSITNVFICIAFYGMRSFQVSDLTNKYSIGTYISARIITSIISIVFCAIFITLNPYTTYEFLCIFIYMGFKTSEAVVDVFHGIDQKAWRMDIVGWSLIIRGVLSLSIFVIIIVLTQSLVLSIIGMALSSYLVILFYDLSRTKKFSSSIKPDFSFIKIKKLLVECFPLLILLLIASFLPMVPRYLLDIYYGSEVLGIYASVATPTIIIQVASTFIFSPLVPLFAEYYQNDNYVSFVKLFIKCIVAIGIIAFVILFISIIWGDSILNILFGNTILPYTNLFIPVMICTILTSASWFFCTILTVFRDFKGIIIGNLVGLILCFILSLTLIKELGMNGVNITILIALSVQNIILIYFNLKKLAKRSFC